MFRPLAWFFRSQRLHTDENDQPIAPPPLDLTDQEIAALRELRSLPEWEVFLRCLDRQSTLYGEGWLSASDHATMARAQGMILGLRKAGILVDEILRDDKERKDADERRRSNAEQRDRSRRTAHFASPAWFVEQRVESRSR